MYLFKSATAIFFVLFFYCCKVSAQSTNVKQGEWSVPSTWYNNTIPSDTDNVVLQYDIVIDKNCSCKSLNTNGHKVNISPGVHFNVSDRDTAAYSLQPWLIEVYDAFDTTYLYNYLKISYDPANKKIYLDSDTLNSDHEYVYEYDNSGNLVKSRHLAMDSFGNYSVITDNIYQWINDNLKITSTALNSTNSKNYYRTNTSKGYFYRDTIPVNTDVFTETRIFDTAGLLVEASALFADQADPFNYNDSVSYKYSYINKDIVKELYVEFGKGPDTEYDTTTIDRGFTSTISLFSFIKKLKGSRLLYFVSMEESDNFISMVPFLELFVNPFYFSDREIYNTSGNQYYPDGAIKNYYTGGYNFYKIYYR